MIRLSGTKKLNDVLEQVLWYKFAWDDYLEMLLLQTGYAVIAYAPRHRKWGIGISKNDPRVQSPKKWQGENIQGKALARVRKRLRMDSNN